MTTTTQRTKLAPTLAQFSIALDQTAGAPTGFADAVAALASVRARKAVIAERRAAVFAEVKVRFDRGDRDAGGGVVLRKTVPTQARLERSVPSAVMRKHDKRLWLAARVPKAHVQVKAPVGEAEMIAARAELAVGSLPPVPTMRTTLDELVAAYQALSRTELGIEETEAVARLHTIAEVTGWDGMPIEFADGWKTSLRHLVYDSDKLREIAPVAWDALATEKLVGASEGHVYLGRQGVDGGGGEGE